MKKYSKHLLFFWLPALLAIIALMTIGNWENFKTVLIYFVLISVWCYLVYSTTYITINGDLIEGAIGIIRKQTLSSKKNQITSVKVDQSIMGRIFNYGTVYINTASGNFAFKFMANPNSIKDAILN